MLPDEKKKPLTPTEEHLAFLNSLPPDSPWEAIAELPGGPVEDFWLAKAQVFALMGALDSPMHDLSDDLDQVALLLRFAYGRLCAFESGMEAEMGRLLLVAPEA
jgi:hypothetical protein